MTPSVNCVVLCRSSYDLARAAKMLRVLSGAVLIVLVSATVDAAWAACPVDGSCACPNSCVGVVTGPVPCRCDCSACPPPPPPPPPTYSGTVMPLYSILAVIYAPPGAASGGIKSSVNYGNSSKTGTSVSSTKSFNSTTGISVSVGGGILGTGGSAQAAFSAGTTASSGSSIAFTKSTNFSYLIGGDGAHDGINHDLDQIFIWGNPKIDMSVTGSQVTWFLNANGGFLDWASVFVGELTGAIPMRASVLGWLQQRGIGPSEYVKIASSDPFAFGPPSTLDPVRYVQTPFSFPYEPPPFPGGPINVLTYNQTDDVTTTSTSTVSQDLRVSASITGSVGFLSFVSSSFTISQSFDFTYGWTAGDTRTGTQSATVTVGGPSFGYTGPIDLAVYWDSVWHSWLFVPIVAPPGTLPHVQGTVLAGGAPAAGQQVVVHIGSATRTTFTNALGEYRFWDVPSGSGTVSSPGGTSAFTRTTGAVIANIGQ